MSNRTEAENVKKYDVIILGAGIAGLWLLNTLSRKGFNVLLIEKGELGGTQTLASQGMIHGGQKYLLQGNTTPEALSIARMPERWQACFDGKGEVDLSGVATLSDTQVMWPAGTKLSEIGLVAAAKLVNAKTKKLDSSEYPKVLSNHGPVYELPERVMNTGSLVNELSSALQDRIVKGNVTELDRNGAVVVDGQKLSAQLVICTAGLGNEEFLTMLGEPVDEKSQRRPLRQIMVKTMEYPLYGHGVVNNPKPRVTVTSHPVEGGYVWYLGGAIAEHAVTLDDTDAILYAKKEMTDIFPEIDWEEKQWATWAGVRAEARHSEGKLKDGPAIQEYGNVIVAWPTKLTFAPLLSDEVLALIEGRGLRPDHTDAPPSLPHPSLGEYPWDTAVWT